MACLYKKHFRYISAIVRITSDRTLNQSSCLHRPCNDLHCHSHSCYMQENITWSVFLVSSLVLCFRYVTTVSVYWALKTSKMQVTYNSTLCLKPSCVDSHVEHRRCSSNVLLTLHPLCRLLRSYFDCKCVHTVLFLWTCSTDAVDLRFHPVASQYYFCIFSAFAASYTYTHKHPNLRPLTQTIYSPTHTQKIYSDLLFCTELTVHCLMGQ